MAAWVHGESSPMTDQLSDREARALYRRPKLTLFSVLQNEARLEWYGTRHERSKPRASGLRKHDDADQKRDQQGSNGKNNLVGRPLVRFFEPAARSVPPSNFVLRRFLLISVQLCPPYATSGGTGWGCGDGERRLRGSLRTGS
jgi:hypothetical protein